MDYRRLYNELTTDPLARGYAGMNDQAAADDLNSTYRTRTRATLDSSEIYENIDSTEFQGKTAAQQAYVRDILGLGNNVKVGPGSKARTVMLAIFGASSTTITTLAAALSTSISRADELALGNVLPADVTRARGGRW